MHDRTRAALEWLLSARGRRLERVLMEQFVRTDGSRSASAMSIWLHFETEELKRVTSLYGESVAVDTQPPDPKDMGDVGSTVVNDVSSESPFRDCVGRALTGVAVVRERDFDDCAGFELAFETGSKLVVVNGGDKLLSGSTVRAVAPACDWVVETL
jgi:hypothetical protein